MSDAPEKLFCLVGDPVAHSLSPFIMNSALEAAGIKGKYVAMRVPIGQLPGAIAAVRAKAMSGVNITYPHKEDVLDLVDEMTDAVEVIGATNTLVLDRSRLVAHNTDCVGAVRALESIGATAIKDKSAAIFGAGGAARAAAFGLLDAGAVKVTFLVRDPRKRADGFVRLRERFGVDRVAADKHGGDAARAVVNAADIVINATPLGMGGTDSTPLPDDSWAQSAQCFFEFVYHPRSTPFLRTAERAGARTIEGLALLVGQAQAGFELWTGHSFPLTDMFDAVRDFVKKE